MSVDECSLCGLCKNSCPVYAVLLSETKSPRGKAALIKKSVLDQTLYECTLCKRCKESCPSNIDLELNNAREELVKNKVETEANQRMINNIRKHGNPFGELEKRKKPKELYCC